MPKSRGRKKETSASGEPVARTPRGPSPAWLAPLMLVLFGIGVLWLIVYYITQGQLPVMQELRAWNLAVGFGFIVAGFALATQWR